MNGSAGEKSRLAQARDAWLGSEEGALASHPESLGLHKDCRQYLENRLVRAFVAGWHACEEVAKHGKTQTSAADRPH